jgi:hypothetical protein
MVIIIGGEVIIGLFVVHFMPAWGWRLILIALPLLFAFHAIRRKIRESRCERAYKKAKARFWAERDAERRGVPLHKRYEKMEAYGRAPRRSHPPIAAMFAERVSPTQRVLAAYERERS